MLCQDAFSKASQQGQTCLAARLRFPSALGNGGMPNFQALKGVNVPTPSFILHLGREAEGAKAKTFNARSGILRNTARFFEGMLDMRVQMRFDAQSTTQRFRSLARVEFGRGTSLLHSN